MTDNQKNTLIDMLQGAYLRSAGDGPLRQYKLFTGNENPVRFVSKTHIPAWNLLRFDKVDKRKLVLNLKAIRKLHGKSLYKKLYKKYRNGKQEFTANGGGLAGQ